MSYLTMINGNSGEEIQLNLKTVSKIVQKLVIVNSHSYAIVIFIISDPRLKTLSESKYKEFRSWFDQRLDDAIAAAEAQENNNALKPVTEGKALPN